MGFYVPDSQSDQFVANKRTNTGEYAYKEQSNMIGMQTQAALQNLNEQYSTAINNAYASYLANQRAISNSAMGQGYKEAYLQNQEQQLSQNVSALNTDISSARAEIESNAEIAMNQVQDTFATEVNYMDRALGAYNDYLTYVNSLKSSEGSKYLTDVYGEDIYNFSKEAGSVDYLYDILDKATLNSYTDENSNVGKSYAEWLRGTLTDSKDDTAFRQWYYGQGGAQSVKNAISNTASNREALFKTRAEEEQARIDTKLNSIRSENKATNIKISDKGGIRSINFVYNGKKVHYHNNPLGFAKNTYNREELELEEGLVSKLSKGDVLTIDKKQYVYIGNNKFINMTKYL